ncbi:MAG TPA: primosomal protein N' [Lachnospiraceae bacterium]|nr:primosomal protein N' [Lachnospiraceae bacterium]
MSAGFADVIVNISSMALDRTFQYVIPGELSGRLEPGSYVRVPFGKGGRLIEGYVLSLSDEPSLPVERLKEIDSVLSDNGLVEGKLIKLAEFIRRRYGSTMLKALKTVFPVKKSTGKKEDKRIVLLLSEEEAKDKLAEYERKHRTARERLLRALMENGSLDLRLVTGKLNVSRATVKALKELGVIDIKAERVWRNPGTFKKESGELRLNQRQREIADDIIKGIREEPGRTCLIRGVTGSGKTEIYMEVIDEVVRSGKQVIVLIPEIALTFQTLMRFYRRFGDRVSTLHSRLSDGERYDQFERARKGEISIMTGPRSALFTPFDRLGLVVIDEEHETSYKSEVSPRYHAREVAVELCRLHGATLILGSATPSLESYYEAERGNYRLYTIESRAKSGARLAKTEIVDLRDEFRAGNRSVFSRLLTERISDRLNKNEQTLLFLNRRGYSGFISCRMCGHVVKCPHCDVALSKHANGRLVCHYCGYERSDIRACPECGSPYIGGMKAGTEQIEELVKKMFPYARTLRMDADTTKRKDDYERILSAFSNREADILIGTQMIVKGHDFPFVTLAGILAADMSLFSNDFRACERTFQLITQAAGRAGRGNREGEVIIQTYNPDHYAIKAAAGQDYMMFYREELAFRGLMDYPPAGHLLLVLVEAKSEDRAVSYMDDLAERINDAIIHRYDEPPVRVIGPSDASVRKLNDIYRRVMYVKSRELCRLMEVKDVLLDHDREKRDSLPGGFNDIRLSFDIDPMTGY